MVADEHKGRYSLRTSLIVGSSIGFGAVLAYLAWLGWHPPDRFLPNGVLEDYYNRSQIIGLALTLILIVACAGWFLEAGPVGIGATGGLLLIYAADWGSRRSDDASFWPLSAFFLGLVSWPAAHFVAYLSARLRARWQRPAPEDSQLA